MDSQHESLNSSGSWFPNPQQMADLAKTGGGLTTPTAPDPQKHLQDANKGKIPTFPSRLNRKASWESPLNLNDRSEIRRIDGETLRFNPDGTVELKIYEFFFQLDELEPEKKARFSESVREAIVGHWLNFINTRGLASRRSLSSSDAFGSYHSQICDLNRPRNVSSCPFEFREIAGERLRFHHPSSEVAIQIDNSYLAFGEVPADRLKEINRSVFLAAENYLRDWRRA